MVLECVPAELAAKITAAVGVPTIGIGAGPDCDGQVQVISDLLGYTEGFLPKHARRFCHVGAMAQEAIAAYIAEVRGKTFPTEENSF
jgi:3-methyl-2-oxobutanoate hydroxymethyltransferase